jgi:uridine kinase
MKEPVDLLVKRVMEAHSGFHAQRVFTVAISGIDASGKGFVSTLLQEKLEAAKYRVANINVDPWQQPLHVRLRQEDAAENFYRNVFRWEDFFEQLITPLQREGFIRLETKLIRTDADEYYSFTYQYENPDILLIDGIFLLQERYLPFYDYKIWVDCSFEKGLQRAIERNIEKLDTDRLINDYLTFYYPAQRLHFEKDNPQRMADIVYDNN